MSYNRRIILLLGVVAALVITYAVGLLLDRPPRPAVIVHRFETGAVDRIDVGSTGLRRRGASKWEVSIGGDWFPADSSKVKRLLSTLSGLTAGRIASTARRDWATFRVDQGHAERLRVEAGGKTVVDLYIGESSSSGGVYLRTASASTVYEVGGPLADFVSGGSRYWSYLRVLPESLSVDSLQTISISAHGFEVGGEGVDETYLLASSVVGGKNRWEAQGRPNVSLDQQKVLSLEAELVRMEGDSFVPGASSIDTGLDHPLARITLSDQQGGSWTLLVGNRDGAQFYVKRGDRPYVYLVNEWTLHRSIPRLSDLVAAK